MSLCAVAADDAVEQRVAVFDFRPGPKRRKWSYKREFRQPYEMRLFKKVNAIVFSNAAN
jgi:hypothetical protein